MPQLPKHLINQILCGDARHVLSQLPDESIDCVVTSPPYWALRDYGVEGQLGLEPSIEAYVNKLCGVFDEVKRVLKKGGTCWVNMGDTYYTDHGAGNHGRVNPQVTKQLVSIKSRASHGELPKKSLCQIPSRFALAMTSQGWILRNEIVWHKPNAMPSSAKDRFTVDFEKLFFFAKNRRYYFAQQFEQLRNRKRLIQRCLNPQSNRKRVYGDAFIAAINPITAEASRKRVLLIGRNKRCVWSIPTRPFLGNHFAVFPQELVKTPMEAGCPKGGIVLDPFVGSGTTALVARSLSRNFIGIDLNPAYVQMAQERLASEKSQTLGL